MNMYFLFGIILLPFLLYVFTGFQPLLTIQSVLQNHYSIANLRRDNLWLFYNYYDFFMFFSIPLVLPFLILSYKTIVSFIKKRKADVLILSFLILTLFINFSKSMNGETGRTWMLFIPFVLLPIINYITFLKNSKFMFISILLLQILQIFVLTTFIVTIVE